MISYFADRTLSFRNEYELLYHELSEWLHDNEIKIHGLAETKATLTAKGMHDKSVELGNDVKSKQLEFGRSRDYTQCLLQNCLDSILLIIHKQCKSC